MDLCCFPRSGSIRAMVVGVLLGLLVECHALEMHAQTTATPDTANAKVSAVRDVRSRHFLIHTDLTTDEAGVFIERLEAMLGPMSRYWGHPLHGVIECYIISNLAEYPVATIAEAGTHGVRTFGGITLMQVNTEAKRPLAKSVMFAAARLDVVQHEAVHAYCYQTFGRVGPVWYSEGMAEMGHFWKKGDKAVHADQREIEFLHNHPPKSLAEPLSPAQVTGDCWQNYASRWALCHFLATNPNYSCQFRRLGHGFVTGKDVSFEQTYAATTRQLFFEYLFFLDHISSGYRADLCAWNWTKKCTCLQPGHTLKAAVSAGRGWQPTGLTVHSGIRYEYCAEGTWQIAGTPESVDCDGDGEGRGRLVGVLMNDDQLGAEFELGANGSFQPDADGDLYLRCRNKWNELAGDVGCVRVKFHVQK